MSVFTDRSAYGNPDPTGAGGVVYLGGYETAPVLLKKEVNPHSNNFTRELAGIQISEGLDGGGGVSNSLISKHLAHYSLSLKFLLIL